MGDPFTVSLPLAFIIFDIIKYATKIIVISNNQGTPCNIQTRKERPSITISSLAICGLLTFSLNVVVADANADLRMKPVIVLVHQNGIDTRIRAIVGGKAAIYPHPVWERPGTGRMPRNQPDSKPP